MTSAMTAQDAAITVLSGHQPATSPMTADTQTRMAVPAAIRATTACRHRRRGSFAGGGSGRSQANGATPSGSQAGGVFRSRTTGNCWRGVGSSSQKAGLSNGERTSGAGVGQDGAAFVGPRGRHRSLRTAFVGIVVRAIPRGRDRLAVAAGAAQLLRTWVVPVGDHQCGDDREDQQRGERRAVRRRRRQRRGHDERQDDRRPDERSGPAAMGWAALWSGPVGGRRSLMGGGDVAPTLVPGSVGARWPPTCARGTWPGSPEPLAISTRA